MSLAAIKNMPSPPAPHEGEGASLQHLLTQVAIRSLCSHLGSEIVFGSAQPLAPNTRFGLWMEHPFTGDLSGTLALGCPEVTLRALTKKEGGDAPANLFKAFENGIARQFKEEQFRCEFSGTPAILKSFQVKTPRLDHSVCPIQTKFGPMQLFLSMDAESMALAEEQYNASGNANVRKIRVNAHHLDRLQGHIKNIEGLERLLLKGAQIRTQLRSEIKRVKRIVHRLKLEPTKLLFSRAERLVSETAKSLGKPIRFRVIGAETSLDKSLLNYLYAPILHLVRNAMDHGIEEPWIREKAGKPEAGYIKCCLGFTEKGIRVLISDDGRGINFPKVRREAVAGGFLSRGEGTERLNSELFSLLFKPGFTTADKKKGHSARGLGLGVVKKEIESVGGTVRFLSSSHHGTSVEIQVPLNRDLVPHQWDSESKEESNETQSLFEETQGLFAQGYRILDRLESSKRPEQASELQEILHSIRGKLDFLPSKTMAPFSAPVEELLSFLSQGELPLSERHLHLVHRAVDSFQKGIDASYNKRPLPLNELQQITRDLTRELWTAGKEDENPRYPLGKLHRQALRRIAANLFPDATLLSSRQSRYETAFTQECVGYLPFFGEQSGYAGILMSEATLQAMITPRMAGTQKSISNVKGGSGSPQLEALKEFCALTGQELTRIARDQKVPLQVGSPLTHRTGSLLPLLGEPTYCYRCELGEHEFYLVGDLRDTQAWKFGTERTSEKPDLPFLPSFLLTEGSQKCLSLLRRKRLKPSQIETVTADASIGFESGVTVLIPFKGKQKYVLLISYEERLAKTMSGASQKQSKIRKKRKVDLMNALKTTHEKFCKTLRTTIKKNHFRITLSPPTLYFGQIPENYVNSDHTGNCIQGTTSKGRFQIQVRLQA